MARTLRGGNTFSKKNEPIVVWRSRCEWWSIPAYWQRLMIEKPREPGPSTLHRARSSAMNFSKHTTRLVGRANLHESGILNAAGRPYIPTPSSLQGPLGSRTLREEALSPTSLTTKKTIMYVHQFSTLHATATTHRCRDFACVRIAASLLVSLSNSCSRLLISPHA